jgi:spore coat polysaccharide biosynthesis predicted glycosyltransferase SpsG
LLRLDADSRIGMGHAVRCASLIQALGRPTDVTLVGSGEALGHFFPKAKIWPRWTSEVRGQTYDFGLIDVASDCGAEVEAARNVCSAPLCAIDDYGSPCAADLIVNGTGPAEQHAAAAESSTTQVLAGARFALIRPCFAAARRETPSARGVVIVVGSGRAAAHWLRALLDARHDWAAWGRVDLVIGAGFTEKKEVSSLAAEHGIRVHQNCSGEELAQRIADAGIAVLTSGMVMYEAMACGAATLAFPHVAATRSETEWFAKRDCLLDLGSEVDPDRIDHCVRRLRGCDVERTRLAQNAAAAVDGQGLERVARAILDRVAT